MDAVLHEVLLAEVIAGIVLIQLLQCLLQLQHHEGEGPRGAFMKSLPTQSSGVAGRVTVSLTWSLGGLGRLAQPKSSLRSRFPSYSKKVRYRLRKNSTCLFFTRSFLGEFQWIT